MRPGRAFVIPDSSFAPVCVEKRSKAENIIHQRLYQRRAAGKNTSPAPLFEDLISYDSGMFYTYAFPLTFSEIAYKQTGLLQ
jgi:hypothetical protein